jgi:hypothetical protein
LKIYVPPFICSITIFNMFSLIFHFIFTPKKGCCALEYMDAKIEREKYSAQTCSLKGFNSSLRCFVVFRKFSAWTFWIFFYLLHFITWVHQCARLYCLPVESQTPAIRLYKTNCFLSTQLHLNSFPLPLMYRNSCSKLVWHRFTRANHRLTLTPRDHHTTHVARCCSLTSPRPHSGFVDAAIAVG